MGRQVRYEYYQQGEPGGSFGDLKSVTTPAVVGTPNGNDFPNGKTTTYTYTTGFLDESLNHNLLTITDPKGQLYLQNIYAHTLDPSDPRYTEDPADLNYDRIVRQIWGNPGDIIDVVYVAQEPTSRNNDAVIKVILNDRVGNLHEYFYDERNRAVIQRRYTGRADPDLPTTETDNRPTGKLRQSDPDFFETRYFWNVDTRLVRTVYPNGNMTVNVYEGDINSEASPRARANLRRRIRLPGQHTPAGDQQMIVETFRYDTEFNSCCGFNFVSEHVDGRGNLTLSDFDAFGNRIFAQQRIPSIVDEWEYNQFGQMTSHTLPDNGSGHRRRDEYTYYDTGHQRGYLNEEIVDATGFALTTTYDYDLVGNVIGSTDPRGNDTQYVVNQLDQTVREISRPVTQGGVRYERDTFYDANDNVVRIDIQNIDDQGQLQPNTHFTTIYEYEILNNAFRMCEEVGSFKGTIPGTPNLPTCKGLPASEFRTTEYAYDENRNRTLVRYGEAVEGRQPGNVVQALYDERDLVFQVIRAPGVPGPGGQSTTQYDYDPNQNLIARREGIEATPHVYINTYDGYDRLVETTDSMGNTVAYHYDENHNRVLARREGELVDVPGNTANVRLTETANVYDAVDRLIRTEAEFFDTETGTTIGDGQSITQTFYSDNSQVIRTVNDNDHQTLTAYDTANRAQIITDHKVNTFEYGYDANSNVITTTETEKSDLGAPDEVFVTTFAYDGLDRQVSVTDNVGNINQYSYDSRDNRTRRRPGRLNSSVGECGQTHSPAPRHRAIPIVACQSIPRVAVT